MKTELFFLWLENYYSSSMRGLKSDMSMFAELIRVHVPSVCSRFCTLLSSVALPLISFTQVVNFAWLSEKASLFLWHYFAFSFLHSTGISYVLLHRKSVKFQENGPTRLPNQNCYLIIVVTLLTLTPWISL